MNDNLKRLNSRETVLPEKKPLLTVDYIYKAGTKADTTTTQIASMKYLKPGTATPVLPELTYTYDVMGNITKVEPAGKTATSYTYGKQNQLLTEVNGINKTSYSYDTYGNIRKITEEQTGLGATGTYTLDYDNTVWLDRLTKVTYTSASGATRSQSLTYDSIGNPIHYYNGNREWDLGWRYGRQLSAAENDDHEISYTYDADGIRKSKTVDGKLHEYVTLDGKVVRETIDEGYADIVVDYFYDNEGKPYKFTVNLINTVYTGYYVLNQQGDVIAVLDENGNAVVEYSYNAWGEQESCIPRGVTGSALNEYNALKYRGYYYDEETGFYYLQNRYYDPVIGRFINSDDSAYLGKSDTFLSYNLFCYCSNNPVVNFDPEGHWEVSTQYKVGIGILLVGVAILAAVPTGGASLVVVGTGLTVSTSTVVAAGAALTVTGAAVASSAGISSVIEKTRYSEPKVVTSKSGKKASDSSKNERHGDGGRAMDKAQRQIAMLEEQLQNEQSGRKKEQIRNKIQRIKQIAQKNKKGENHSQRPKQ